MTISSKILDSPLLTRSNRNPGDEITDEFDGRMIITTHLIGTRLQYWESILPDCQILTEGSDRISTVGVPM
jgi:hypothetical protein